MKRNVLIAALISLLIVFTTVQSTVQAAEETLKHVFFSAYDPDATERFNSIGDTDREATRVDVDKESWRTIAVHIATLNSTSITVKIYGKVNSLWALLYSKPYSATTTDPEPITISERCSYLAVGLVSAGDAAGDSVSVQLEASK